VPPVKIFQTLREEVEKRGGRVPQEQRAIFWWQRYGQTLRTWQQRNETLTYQKLAQREFTKQIVGSNHVQPGFFYFYLYDPKWKKQLPYYDKFPFTLVLDVKPDRFLGLNFHYLDYFNRARLFDLLYGFREGQTARPNVRDIRMRLRLSYQLLSISSKYQAFKPCLKEYLISHVRTPLIKVGAREWDVALFLPVESFEKQTKQQVWRKSRRMF
jgi:hypothetical protein